MVYRSLTHFRPSSWPYLSAFGPIRPFAGNQALLHGLRNRRDRQSTWVFNVLADGYSKVDADGRPEAVDTLMVNEQTRRLTVVKAMKRARHNLASRCGTSSGSAGSGRASRRRT
ncbi:hypothetical protein diail_3317 [Diaporthe ilicicola]|nr:hypothetical protein diail_3317 [Diaporthe ilicicola]